MIAGRYKLDAVLGRGGMGEVWAATDTRIQRAVAIKLLQPIPGTDDGAELFEREARTAGALSHRGVVTIHDLGHDGETLYLVMELLDGQDLARKLARDGIPPLDDVLEWTAQAADALHAAHGAGIVHRDLKPANVLLTSDGTVKIVDFGIARYASATTMASRIIGTVHYMPPERLAGKAGDGRADLYSLGCMLIELLTGQPPFAGRDATAIVYAHAFEPPTPPSEHRSDIPPALDTLVLELLAKEPEDRPASAAQVRDRLRDITAPPPASPRPRPLPHPSISVQLTHPPTELDPSSGGPGPATHPVTVADPGPDHRSLLPTQTAASDLGAVTGDERASDDVALVSVSRRRRWYLIGAVAVAVIAAVSAAIVPPLLGPGLPQLNVRWTYFPAQDVAASTPLVADGIVYISTDDTMHAFNASTGTEKWNAIEFGSVRAETIRSGVLYYGTDYVFYARDAATGHQRWKFTGDLEKGEQFLAAPVVRNGIVYATSTLNRLYAFDASTGSVRWQVPIETPSGPALAGGLVIVGNFQGPITGFDASTGTIKWTRKTHGHIGATPVVVGSTVYVSSQNDGLYALNTASGAQKWHFGDPHARLSAPTLEGGTLYVGRIEGDENGVYAIEASTGTKQWQASTGTATDPSQPNDPTVPAFASGIVYDHSQDGNLYALSSKTGSIIADHSTGHGYSSAGPAVANGTVYVGGTHAGVYAFDVSNLH